MESLAPAYLQLLPEDALPTTNLEDFLTQLAQRMGMVKRGAELDFTRAAMYFVRWWREEGGLVAASSSLKIGASRTTQGWGFDFQWRLESNGVPIGNGSEAKLVQDKMESCIDEYLINMGREDAEENNLSESQIKKQQLLEKRIKRKLKHSKR
jgi:mitochondrial GTPase 1